MGRVTQRITGVSDRYFVSSYVFDGYAIKNGVTEEPTTFLVQFLEL